MGSSLELLSATSWRRLGAVSELSWRLLWPSWLHVRAVSTYLRLSGICLGADTQIFYKDSLPIAPFGIQNWPRNHQFLGFIRAPLLVLRGSISGPKMGLK